MNEFIGIMEIVMFDDDIPTHVKLDVSKRVTDWCKSGGSETDTYIKRQYEYLLEVKENIK